MSETTGEQRTNEYQEKPGGQFKAGNPGRPAGTLNFATKWRKFIEKVADKQNVNPEDIDEQLWFTALKKAKEGDYQFYRDIHDRVYGKPQQHVDHTTDGQQLPTPILGHVLSNDSNKEDTILTKQDTSDTGGD